MSALLQDPKTGRSQAPLNESGSGRLFLADVDWESYEKFLEAVGNRPIRLTFDSGRLEIVAPLWNHEFWKVRLDRLVLVIAEETGVDIICGGSTTFRRKDLSKGLEPDNCYYVQNARLMTGKKEIDLAQDPPPDLAIEVDNTSSSLDRMSIYAALGVPEVWRYDRDSLQIFLLAGDGGYAKAQSSRCFPRLPMSEVVSLIDQTDNMLEIEASRFFRAWFRQRIADNSSE